VGVIGVRPAEDGAAERIVSGPDKIRGGTKDDFRRQVQSLQREFVGAVMFHRSDELTISRTQVAHAKVYIGARAVQNGLADRIGSHHDAIVHAAARAGITRYNIVSGFNLARTGAAASLAVVSQNETTPPALDADTVDRRRILALYGQPDTPEGVVTNATG
jgi:protease-4